MKYEDQCTGGKLWIIFGALGIAVADITLQRGEATLIIDTKYYGANMQVSQFGTRSLHSGNLYQISAYVQHAAALHDSVAGLYSTRGPVVLCSPTLTRCSLVIA